MIGAAISEEYRCLVDILTCLVCKELVTQAHICPNCSKFYCLGCINRQLAIEQKCLHCEKVLSPEMLRNCEQLCFDLRETLQKVKLRSVESARMSQDKSPYYCYLHKLEKTYYCQTCERPLCSDCSVLTELHRGHDFVKLSIIKNKYEHRMALKLQDLNVVRQQIAKKADLVTANSHPHHPGQPQGLPKLQANMKSLKEQLKKKLKRILTGTETKMAVLTQNVERWNQLYQKWLKVLKNSSKGKFIEQEHDLMSQGLANVFQQVATAQADIQQIKAHIDSQNSFSNYIQPDFYTYTFILQNFSSKRNSLQHFYTEVVETKEGLKLRLKIYPKGIKSPQDENTKAELKMMKRQSKNQEYFAVFIELVQAPASNTKLKHEIALNNQYTEGKVFKREFQSQFDVGLCWGYENYMKLSQLYEQGYYNREFDFIEIQLKIGPYSYYQATKDQQALLQQKQLLRSQQQKTLKGLRSVLEPKQSAETSSDIEICMGLVGQ